MRSRFSQLTDAVKPNGGNAVDGVSRINQANVAQTYSNFMEVVGELLQPYLSHTAIIGSAGKKAHDETSGDIDVAVQGSSHSDIYDTIVTRLDQNGYKFRDMRSLGIISIAYPIMNYDDKQERQYVQIDLMFVDSLEYAKWGFYSPHYTQSEYKGLYRNELNFFIAKHAELNPLRMDGNIVTEWERYWFSTKDGLLHGRQTLISEKTGKIVKTPRVVYKRLVTNDPDEVASFLYGPSIDSAAVLTLEDALREMQKPTFRYKHNYAMIIEDTIRGIQKKGYPVPPIIA